MFADLLGVFVRLCIVTHRSNILS